MIIEDPRYNANFSILIFLPILVEMGMTAAQGTVAIRYGVSKSNQKLGSLGGRYRTTVISISFFLIL